jgi:hypothetical protein
MFAFMAFFGAVKFLVLLAVFGLPFYLWQQGDIWGQATGILSGVLIYGTAVGYAVEKVRGAGH